MRVAILGGGITGLTASYYLAKKGHQVTVFEKSKVVGGLALGFKSKKWGWHLEYAYHHLFANDKDIINFSKEIGFDEIFFKSPETASLFDDFKIHKMDSPIDLLKLPQLNIFDKFRAGIGLAFLKISPFFKFYENLTSKEYIKKTMGNTTWNRLWQELFRKKFGDYAEIILASFIWARIKKRTKKLGYIRGGFQSFINHLVSVLKKIKVSLITGSEIKVIKKIGEKYIINSQTFDVVISTLPTPILTKITDRLFPAYFLQKFRKLKYLHALTLIVETKKPILKNAYWLNISTAKIPIMGIIQHTNYIDKKYYGNSDICYLAWYLKREDGRFRMTGEELLKSVWPYLKKINLDFDIPFTNYQSLVTNHYLFHGPFAQPIFDKSFVKNRPDFRTPLKNFFIANLDMTYPYDRGTNYAVKLGREVAEKIIKYGL